MRREEDKMNFEIQNRRYLGSKFKLIDWIVELVKENTSGNSFLDLFSGTGIVTKAFLNYFDEFIINDFLYSNNIIYKAFFSDEPYSKEKLLHLKNQYNSVIQNNLDDDYFVNNYGGKYFSNHDARKIGEIREMIAQDESINEHEKSILLASLLYSTDRIANTVGHYDAYRKKSHIDDRFVFNLISPINTKNKDISIYREDANELAKHVKADVAFIDPPYNSRQYSRFYHVLEEIIKWDKPKLSGVAMKPPVENMSDYSKSSAPQVFEDLIHNLNVKYIVVTYNNTYKSKSNSSKNKISHEEILNTLNSVGETKVFNKSFRYFNAGKTNLNNHREYLFITKVG
ncbi:DNA adenine methylase [Ligilactobacillus cholophilus]|uniref:DNA adenine methylase n=1 Tax=Ligilactobacillus cholophilus TaxID=3050131 RepID=UPI0025B1C9F1|nr:DNA adenine methylase [Ligilactobacillus cholophilus]